MTNRWSAAIRTRLERRRVLALGMALGGICLMDAEGQAGVLDALWTAPTTNSDGTRLTDLASYRVYYGATTSPCRGSSFVQVASPTGAPSASQTVSARLRGLATGTRYYAAVSAVDTQGHESSCSSVASAVAQLSFGVSPAGTVSFGTVNRGSVADRTITVSNTRVGAVAGTVSTSAPFSIVSGSSFNLVGQGATHVVTVRFTPTVTGTSSVNVNVSADGDSVSRLVTGSGAGTAGETTRPTVTVTSPTSGTTYTTGASAVTLAGRASDNVGVTQVTWANGRGGSGTASGTTSWTASGISLQTGSNVLTVTARDASGNTATTTLTVNRTAGTGTDTTRPTVTITSPTSSATYTTSSKFLVPLSGRASDSGGVTRVTWANDRGGSGVASGTTTWSAGSITLQPGLNVLTVTVRDAAGNTATATLRVNRTS
jgi:Big-like domain-containing protein